MRKQSLKFAIYSSIVIAIGCNLSQIILYHFALRMPVNVLNYFQNNKKKRMFPLQSLHYSQMLLLTFIIEIVHTHMWSFLLNTRKGVTENNKDWEGVRWSYIEREWEGEGGGEWRGDWEKDRAKKKKQQPHEKKFCDYFRSKNWSWIETKYRKWSSVWFRIASSHIQTHLFPRRIVTQHEFCIWNDLCFASFENDNKPYLVGCP